MQPPAAAAAAAASEPLPGKALGKRKAGTAEPQADGAGGKNPAAPAAPRGRPPSLAASGAASMDAVRAISAQAHGAPRKGTPSATPTATTTCSSSPPTRCPT